MPWWDLKPDVVPLEISGFAYPSYFPMSKRSFDWWAEGLDWSIGVTGSIVPNSTSGSLGGRIEHVSARP